MCVLKTELYKAFHNKRFCLVLVICGMFVLVNAFQNIKLVREFLIPGYRVTTMTLSNGAEWITANASNTSVYYNWLGVSSMELKGVLFCFLFPLFAAIPYSGENFVERKNGYRNQLLIRIPKKWEVMGKYAATALSGGAVVTIPIIFDFLLGALIMPMTHPVITDEVIGMSETQLGSALFYNSPNIFVCANIALMFIWGAALAVTALAIGQLVRRKIVAVVSPFCICLLVDLVFEIGFIRTNTEWSPIRLFHMVTIRGTSGFVIAGEILFLFLVSSVIFFIRGMSDEGV